MARGAETSLRSPREAAAPETSRTRAGPVPPNPWNDPLLRGTLRTLRYARSWKACALVTTRETEIDREGEAVPATLVLPAARSAGLPAWIALGGVSRMGRFHPQLVRFARALASTGTAVLVPEIPEWRRLDVNPRVALPTIRGCIASLARCAEVRSGKVGLIGFSFGAPQVALAAGQDDVAEHAAGIALFGGYCCLERTVVCQFTGNHEWEGTGYELDPDPYGRWVMAGRHLTDIEGLEDATDVAAALYRLAVEVSEKRIAAWDPHHDSTIAELRIALPARRRPLFDLFATPSTAERPDRDEGLAIARRLARAARRVEPLLDPGDHLSGIGVPTRLIHGRGDRLIPFTESMRLGERLPLADRQALTVTRLFAHSADQPSGSLVERVREKAAFFGTLRGLINTV